MKLFNIPFAIGLCIDDMGWRLCRNDKAVGGPPRLHGTEDPRPEFYKGIVEMAKNCGVRVQGSFIMSEFDKNNICAKPCYNKPEAPIDITEKGLNWTNEVSEEDSQIMDYVKEENAYLEFGLHGVRHGHFEGGKFHESEWANRPFRDEKDKIIGEEKNVLPWDKENKTNEVIADCYTELIRQYFTEEELSFPETFAPPHHALYYNKNDKFTTGNCLGKRGVKYANSKLTGTLKLECDAPRYGVVDCGMHLVDRRTLRRSSCGRAAENPLYFPRPVPWIETHFINFWYRESEWSHYLFNINKRKHRMLGKNTEQIHSQFVYNKFARIYNLPGKIIIDTTRVPDEIYENNLLSALVLKVKLKWNEHVETVEGATLTCYYKDQFGYSYLTLGSNEEMGRLPKGKFVIKYKVSKNKPKVYVDNAYSTFNVYNLTVNDSEVVLKLKNYGTQTIRMKCFEPKKIDSDLNILNTYYAEGFLYITLKSKSMNGDTGEVVIRK